VKNTSPKGIIEVQSKSRMARLAIQKAPAPAPVALDAEFIAKVSGPLHSTWQYIGHDAMEVGVRSNRDAMEMVLDAGRINDHSKEAGTLLEAAYKEHGFAKVFKFLCAKVKVY
jgi:hypothetical protein